MLCFMKIKELRDKSNEELKHELRELNAELFNLRSRKSTGQLDKPHRLREVRKTIARIKTILSAGDTAPAAGQGPVTQKAGQSGVGRGV